MRYSLVDMLWLVAAIAAPFGLATIWPGGVGWLICIATSLVMLLVTCRKFFAIILAGYVVSFVVASVYVIWDVGNRGPYVRKYNLRMEKLANEAALVGSSEERVEIVLGPATGIYSGWSATIMKTGKAAPGAVYWTTYNYAPYPSFPFGKFQVHCNGGIVRSIELYDD